MHPFVPQLKERKPYSLFSRPFSFRQLEMCIEEETNAPLYRMQCTIDGISFPPGELQGSKKDAKHAAASKAISSLLAVELEESDTAAVSARSGRSDILIHGSAVTHSGVQV